MIHVKMLTEKNRERLLALPVGFTVQLRILGPYNPQTEWTVGTVERVADAYNGLELAVRCFCPYRQEFYTWNVYETSCHTDRDPLSMGNNIRTGKSHLSTGSGAEVTVVRWSAQALATFRALDSDPVLAATVAGLIS
jgi:hypothetical protein